MNQFYVNTLRARGFIFSAGVQNDHANIDRIKQFDILEFVAMTNCKFSLCHILFQPIELLSFYPEFYAFFAY